MADHTFRFVAGEDMFFSPWQWPRELERLFAAVEERHEAVESDRMFLCVTS